MNRMVMGLAAAAAAFAFGPATAAEPGDVTWTFAYTAEYTSRPDFPCQFGPEICGVPIDQTSTGTYSVTLPYNFSQDDLETPDGQKSENRAEVVNGNLILYSTYFFESSGGGYVDTMTLTGAGGHEDDWGVNEGGMPQFYTFEATYTLIGRDGPAATPVPEPVGAGPMLAALGAFGLLAARRRR